jgi:uncharacterized membrane protein
MEAIMEMRIHELHPALVHLPIVLLPATLGVDAIGKITANRTLLRLGRIGIGGAFASLVVAATAGLVAQQVSRTGESGRRKLVTHRNLNVGVLAMTGLLATGRARGDTPSLGYLAGGLAAVGVMGYSSYLGGSMVYEDGVGVANAGGLEVDESPKLSRSNIGILPAIVARHIVEGVKETVRDLREDESLPWFSVGSRPAAHIGNASQPRGHPAGVDHAETTAMSVAEG